MNSKIYCQLSVMMFLQLFVWGSWFVTLGSYLANIGFSGAEIRRIAGDVAIELAIQQTEGNLQEAAKRLDVSDRLVQGFSANSKK